jgi:hypothetical protein
MSGICPVGAGLEYLSRVGSRHAAGRKSSRPAGFRHDRSDRSDLGASAGALPGKAGIRPEYGPVYDSEDGADVEVPLGIGEEPLEPGPHDQLPIGVRFDPIAVNSGALAGGDQRSLDGATCPCGLPAGPKGGCWCVREDSNLHGVTH